MSSRVCFRAQGSGSGREPPSSKVPFTSPPTSTCPPLLLDGVRNLLPVKLGQSTPALLANSFTP